MYHGVEPLTSVVPWFEPAAQLLIVNDGNDGSLEPVRGPSWIHSTVSKQRPPWVEVSGIWLR